MTAIPDSLGSRDFTEDSSNLSACPIEVPPEIKKKYPAKSHARAVARHLGVTNGLIYLPGQPSQTYEDSDQPLPFRQRRYFYYLSGINFPNCLVTYNIQLDRLYAWIPPPNTGRAVIFDGQVPSIEEVKAAYELDGVGYVAEIDAYLTYFAHKARGKIYVISSDQRPDHEILNNLHLEDGSTSILNSSVFDTTLLKPSMNASRAIKSQHEIALIRHANTITAAAHLSVLKNLKSFTNESEIEATFISTCISSLAKTQAYGIIAASGTNASTLHYIADNAPLSGRELVCLDAGCEWDCYASDVTRTFPISGSWSKEAGEVYAIVESMQRECVGMIGPGVDFRAMHRRAHEVALKGLMRLGILKGGTVKEIWESGVTVAFFSHGLGHFLGLEVHDVGPTGYLLCPQHDNTPNTWHEVFQDSLSMNPTTPSSILQPNMVITVEPGIYFPRPILSTIYLPNPRYSKYIDGALLEKYYPVGGVRIEDDVLVTEDGWENLTTAVKGEEAERVIRGEEGEV